MRGNIIFSIGLSITMVLILGVQVLAQENIKLIVSFEKSELQLWDAQSELLTFTEITQDSLELLRLWVKKYYFTKRYALQGEFSLFEEIDAQDYAYRKTMLDPEREPDSDLGDREWYIERYGFLFRAFQWFRDVFEKDWSLWDYMWIDVLSTDADAIIRVLIEDRWDASCIRRYEIPAGQVVTIRFALRDVANINELDLTEMNNFWITLEEESGPTKIIVDNIRLAKQDAIKNDGIPFVDDDSQIVKRSIPGVVTDPIEKQKVEKVTDQISDPLVPITISVLETNNYPFLGGNIYGNHERAISAFDNNKLLVILSGRYKDINGIYAVASFDGGYSWKGIDSTDTPTFICNGRAVRHRGAFENSTNGDGFLVIMRHCHYIGGLSDILFYKFTFTGNRWELSPEITCYNLDRHCPEGFSFINLPNGIYWTAFDNWDNINGIDIHAVLSKNEGYQWGKLNKSPLVNVTSDFSSGIPFLTNYNDGVACIWRSSWNKITWATNVGQQWIENGLVFVSAYSSYPYSVITVNENKIFVAFKDENNKLYVNNLINGSWQNNLIDDSSDGKILRVILTSVAEIPYCIWVKEIDNNNYSIYYRRYNYKQKIWETRFEILSGESDEIFNLSAPIKSPINYIPLLYDSAPIDNINSDNSWLKLIKIPVDTNLVVPVELASFSGQLHDNYIALTWVTKTETNNYGFEIQRKCYNNDFSKIGFVKGNVNSSVHHEYTFFDQNVLNVNYYYRLKQVDLTGAYNYSNIIEVKTKYPEKYLLDQNYPNPFNSKTHITYSLSSHDLKQVNLSIYNIMEQEVRTLVNEKQSAGNYSVSWDGKNNQGVEVPSGIYLYKLKINNYYFTRKMLLVK